MSYAAEACMIAASVLVYVLYHIWFFYAKGSGFRQARMPGSRHHTMLFNLGKVARVQFTAHACETDDTIIGIQQARNALQGVTFMTVICSLLAQQVLSILLDVDKQAQVVQYSVRPTYYFFCHWHWDPFSVFVSFLPLLQAGGLDDGLVGPQPILGVNFLLLLACLLAFAHSVRTYINMGFFIKAAANQAQPYITKWDAVETTIQAQVAFTIGQRFLFFFPVTALWLIGPTAMVCSAVVTTALVAMLDRFTVHDAAFEDIMLRMAPHHHQSAP